MSDSDPTNITVLLVHGGFADSSSWNDVLVQLFDRGVTAWAVTNPLRGVTEDSTYVASAMRQIDGPVLAVGHSYGGTVITNAASKVENVKGLVYVAAFIPDDGEAMTDIEKNSKDSVLVTALQERTYPTHDGGKEVELYITPEKFREAFAGDLPPDQTRLMQATQRPFSAVAFGEPTSDPAWRKLPSWAIVPIGDKAAGTDVLRHMAQRANAKTTEVEGSHVIMMSQPQVVTDTIMEALAALT